MGQRDVLSLDSVDRIRFYVRTKYEHLPKDKHAEIVADAIVKIITRQLPPFSKELQDHICQELISQVIVAQQRPVSIEDIERLSLHKVLGNVQAQQQLSQWRVEHGLSEVMDDGSRNWAQRLWSKLKNALYRQRKVMAYSFGCLVIVGGVMTAQYIQQQAANKSVSEARSADILGDQTSLQGEPLASLEQLPSNELPNHYQFHDVDHSKLKAYLESRSSLLTEQRYYDVIVETAKQFNISPVLLFAITGQEQGFVPRDHEKAEVIANNPFNVFHSWQDYNTTIEQSTGIAARTIVNLSKDRPDDVEAITWINRKYAEDPNWSKGVTSLYTTIINYIND
jgi:hypothetical protein